MPVALAEDGLLFRDGRHATARAAGSRVTAGCAIADELLEAVDEEPPDVALLDVRMPPTHTDEGVRTALEIRARHPSVGVLVLSQYLELGLAMKLFEGRGRASATCSTTPRRRRRVRGRPAPRRRRRLRGGSAPSSTSCSRAIAAPTRWSA